MPALLFPLVCLACIGHGARVQRMHKRLEGAIEDESSARGAVFSPLKELASLLLASNNPAAAWQNAMLSQNLALQTRVEQPTSRPTKSLALGGSSPLSQRARPAMSRAGKVLALSGGATDVATTNPEPVDPAVMFEKPIPVTVLSGFLGSGKTTLLKHILENTEGIRVGVIVNDVAAINVDAKLVIDGANQGISGGNAEDMIELSNGCACCSAGDDFWGALAGLVTRAMTTGNKYDYIVFEASGVSEPRLMRSMFQEAEMQGWPIMKAIKLESMVTVVDASNFLELYSSTDRVSDRSDLGGADDALSESGMWSAPPGIELIPAPTVVQLLVEQVETADVIVLNKIDNVDEAGLKYLKDSLAAINGFAELRPTTFGVVPPTSLLVENRQGGVANSNEIMDHQSSVDFAKWMEAQTKPEILTQPQEKASDSHSHEHSHSSDGDHSDHHDHSHEDSHSHQEHSHAEKSHSHHEHSHAEKSHSDHEHSHAEKSHSHHEHSHASDSHHEHSHAGDCNDPGCTDPTHNHDDRQDTTAARRFGITTFVYTQRRPFVTERFEKLLGDLPFARLSKSTPRALTKPNEEENGTGGKDGPFAPVMRSKGFLWLSTENMAALYWSQAGRQIEVAEMGRWWASVDRVNWPEGHIDAILADCSGDWGDRRQELVFIGANMDQAAITSALDACLATDEEMPEIEAQARSEGMALGGFS